MVQDPTIADPDVVKMKAWLSENRIVDSVAEFVPGSGIEKLTLRFDIAALREALDQVLGLTDYQGDMRDLGFAAIPLTRRPGEEKSSANDLSGRHWLRANDRYLEEPREDPVDEAAFSEFVPLFQGTYFEHVHKELARRFPIGRLRIMSKDSYNCNSWHRDPEPRLHIPVITNPGALFIVNHHVTHLPADGSVYFTDTRGYHSALNGGEHRRVHIVAALPA